MDVLIHFKTVYFETKVCFIGNGKKNLFFLIRSVALIPKPEPDNKLPSTRTIPEIFWQ